MVTYKQFISEARFDVSSATARPTQLSMRPAATTTYPVQTVAKAVPVKTTPFRAISTTPAITVPKIAPAVTTRNIPTPISASKNGRLQPNELVKVGKYNAGAAGRAQWYGDNAYLAPDAAQAFLSAQQSYGRNININSAYRNLNHQAGVSRQYRVAAAPGRSRHGLGKAIDLQPGTPEYNWMKINGPKYGWHFAAIKGDPYHFEYRG